MVSIAARPPLAAAGSGTGSLPARVTGHTRQNQSHNALNAPAVVARAPAPSSARSTTRTSAAPGAAMMTATERVRNSIDRNHERRSMDQRGHEQPQAEPLEQMSEDPLERLSADLTALSLQHAAAMAAAAGINTATPISGAAPAAAEHPGVPAAVAPTPHGGGRQHTPSGRVAAHAASSFSSLSSSSSSLPSGGAGSTSSANAVSRVPVRGPAAAAGPAATATLTSALADSRRFELGLGDSGLPTQLLALRDPACPVALPPPGGVPSSCLPLDNWKLDKLVLSLSANKATWRRSLLLFEWLKMAGHQLDDRLCTTLIRVCSDHGDAVSALAVYDWMTGSAAAGGAGLEATAYTYTAAMRAALAGGLTDRALSLWNDAWRRHSAGRLQMDCRLCITYLELCTRLGLTDQALAMYGAMRAAPAGSRMMPTVHAYTAAMRAATEGGRWYRALDIWADMRGAGCEPTGHAYSAAISACAAAGDWNRAVALFDEMTGPSGIRPDVVSCTALITALAAGGEADRAEAVVAWMLANSVRPNARTYTALMAALGNAKRWTRAVEVLGLMQTPEWGGVQPNAYTYSALLKSLGEHGQWQLAEAVFSSIERQVLGPAAASASPAAAALAMVDAMTAPSAAAAAAAPPPPPLVNPLTALLAQAAVATTTTSVTADVAAVPIVDTDSNPSVATATAAAAASRDLPVELPMDPVFANGEALPHHTVAAAVGFPPSAAASPQWTWTRPSQLHGLNVDLTSLSGGGAAAAAGPDAGADPPRRSFSLFSHPPAAAPPSTPPSPASAASTAAGACGSFHASSSSGSGRSSLGSFGVAAATGDTAAAASMLMDVFTSVMPPPPPPLGESSRLWRSALDNVSAGETLSGQMTAAAAAGGCGAAPVVQVMNTPMGHVAVAPGTGVPSAPLAFPMGFAAGSADASSLTATATSNLLAGPPVAAPGGAAAAAALLLSTPAPSKNYHHNSYHGHNQQHHHHGSASVAASAASSHPSLHQGVLNEVVCGALMLAYERAGKWQEAVGVLLRAMNLGVTPNTVMYNTAISAAGKAGQLEIAEKLYRKVRQPDAVTHEAMIAAYGMSGLPDRAEAVFSAMTAARMRPRDFAFCGLIAAHSLAGNWEGAMRVRARMRRGGLQPSVDVYNALLAACERAGQPDKALELLDAMRREGVEPNPLTGQLLALVGRQGVRNIENQQVAAAALSAAMAAYGTLLMQTGLF